MTTFTVQAVRDGIGPWHLNYFRVFITPKQGLHLPDGQTLMTWMPRVLNPVSASVAIDGRRAWGRQTLAFKGVADVKPLSRIGIGWKWFTMPPVHADYVGLPMPPSRQSFTAQTLQRHFETGDDRTIRSYIRQQAANHRKAMEELRKRVNDRTKSNHLGQGFERWLANKAIDLAEADEASLVPIISDYLVFVNQHHFLAGRRSFRIGLPSDFKLNKADFDCAGVSPASAGLWVFETAAVERYSRLEFAGGAETALGGNTAAIEPIWRGMCANLAKMLGRGIGHLDIKHDTVWTDAGVLRSPVYQAIKDRHMELLPHG